MPKYHPLRLDSDSPQMREAIRRLSKLDPSLRRTSPYQLKIGPLNYYPQTGTIFIDGGIGTLPKKGMAVLEKILAEPHETADEISQTCEREGYIAFLIELHL